MGVRAPTIGNTYGRVVSHARATATIVQPCAEAIDGDGLAGRRRQCRVGAGPAQPVTEVVGVELGELEPVGEEAGAEGSPRQERHAMTLAPLQRAVGFR